METRMPGLTSRMRSNYLFKSVIYGCRYDGRGPVHETGLPHNPEMPDRRPWNHLAGAKIAEAASERFRGSGFICDIVDR
jgi:hypothetical protein